VVSRHIREDRPSKEKSVCWEPKLKPQGVEVADLALYRAEKLVEHPDRPAMVCEGEAATDALASLEDALGVVAVGTVTGAAGTPGDAALQPLVSRRVILWPDADDAGARHMQRIGLRLRRLGCHDILIVDWHEAPEHGDAADSVALGVDVAALIAAAQPWSLLKGR
jgi:hypothetical protein